VKAQKMSRGINLLIPKLGIRLGMGGQCHASHTISLAKSPITSRGGWFGQIQKENPLSPLGFNPWFIKPIVSHRIHYYTFLAPNIESAFSL